MGTTGFSAQAAGRGDSAEVRATVARGLILAAGLGLVLVVLQVPIAWAAFELLSAPQGVERLARDYYDLRIWAAPASLATFTVTGALIGLGCTRQVLVVQLVLNGLNIFLDILFAGVLGWDVAGIALGTALAEWTAVGIGLWLLRGVLRQERRDDEPWWPTVRLRDMSRARAMIGANTDIMIRTLFLLLGFGWFTNQGALFGPVILAANHVLLQLTALSAYLLDGYANATEILVGRAVGTRQREALRSAMGRSTEVAALTALAFAGVALLAGPWIIARLTTLPAVREMAEAFLPFTAAYIALSWAAFQLDGIFIGATATRAMRNASVVSCLVFIAVSLPLIGWW